MTKKQRLLAVLEDGHWHPYRELLDMFGASYCARMREMRREGYDVRSRLWAGSNSRTGKEYRLFGRKRPEPRLVKAYMQYEDVKEALERGILNDNLKRYLGSLIRTWEANGTPPL